MEQPTSSRAGKPWDAAEESVLLQSLSAGIMPEEIAGCLQRKVGGINSRRYTIAERIVSQGGTIAPAAELVKYTSEQVKIHMNKVAVQPVPAQKPASVQTDRESRESGDERARDRGMSRGVRRPSCSEKVEHESTGQVTRG